MRIRSILKKVFVPHLPSQSIKEVRAGLSWTVGLASTLKEDTVNGDPCPLCGHQLRFKHDHFIKRNGKKTQVEALCCEDPECNYVTLFERKLSQAEASQRPRKLRRSARQQIYICVAVLVISALIALYIHSIYTIGGGILLSFYIFLRALRVRYRAWQLEQNRLFEARAPLRDWLSYELSRFQA